MPNKQLVLRSRGGPIWRHWLSSYWCITILVTVLYFSLFRQMIGTLSQAPNSEGNYLGMLRDPQNTRAQSHCHLQGCRDQKQGWTSHGWWLVEARGGAIWSEGEVVVPGWKMERRDESHGVVRIPDLLKASSWEKKNVEVEISQEGHSRI